MPQGGQIVKVKVIDSHNAGFSWVAEKCSQEPNSAIFTFSKIAKHLMLLNMVRYGVKNVPVDTPDKFFASLIKKQFLPLHQVCSILNKSLNILKGKSGFERDLLIWRCLRILISEKANMDDNLYKDSQYWQYINLETYEDFKKHYNSLNLVTGFDVIKECIDRGIKASIKNLFILGYEDGYKLLYEAINKCIVPENIYYIGDPYRYTTLYSNSDNIEFNSTIDLNSSLQIPANMYNYFSKLKNNLGIPYDVKPSSAFGRVNAFKDIHRALNYLQNKQFELACVVYENPMYAEYVESLLFNKNIPFKGVTEKYKFPFDLYVIYNIMENVCNNKGIIQYKEIKTLVDSIKGEITDKFGGKKALMKTFSLPAFTGSTLHKVNFFKYLIKAWVSSSFQVCLHNNLALQWAMWKGKFTRRWYSPDIYCGIVTSMKYLNPDYSICVASLPEENDRLAYTMLTVTKNELILV